MNKNLNLQYFEIDELTNSIDSLKKTKEFLNQIDDPFRWKWISISLVNALYGFMICALNQGDYYEVIDLEHIKKSDKRRLDSLPQNGSSESDKERENIYDSFIHSNKARLITFNEAFNKIKAGKHITLDISEPIEITQTEEKNIFKLKDLFRNNFEHYRPLGWSLEQLIIIPLVRDAINVLGKICSCGNFIMYDNNTMNECNLLIKEIPELIDKNESHLKKLY